MTLPHRQFLLALLAVFTFLPVLEGRTQVETEPVAAVPLGSPGITWCRSPGQVRVRVTPPEGAKLAEALPVIITLDDGLFYRVRWSEAVTDPQAPLEVAVPGVRRAGAETWTLEVEGAVCSADGSQCRPFFARGDIGQRGPRRGRLEGDLRPSPDKEPSRPPAQPSVHDVLPWFSAQEAGSIDAALEGAQATGRNLLVDFHAQWCPPCEHLRTEFLERPERAELLSSFVLLEADADHPSSFELKNRYEVGGYPTLLVLSPSGELLDRIVGWSGRPDELAARLAAQAGGPDEAGLSQVRALLARGDAQAAWEVLGKTDRSLEEWLLTDPQALDLALQASKEAEPAWFARLAELAARAARTPGRAASLSSMAARALEDQGDPARAQALRDEFGQQLEASAAARSPLETAPGRGGETLAGTVTVHDAAIHDGFADAAWARSDWSEDPEESRRLLQEAAIRIAATLLFELDPEGTRLPRLPDGRASLVLPLHLLSKEVLPLLVDHQARVHALVHVLDAAGLPEVCRSLLEGMIQLLPGDFTWHYKLAGKLAAWGDAEDALPHAQRAFEASYGDNRLRAARRLAELLGTLGRKTEALDVVARALANPAPVQEKVRSHRYRAALAKLQEELEGE